ncbi:retrovirus-related Pol polyprotein from transposon 297 [Nephila pilipes]|uniref:RNA-directed DNA polymerase n=1 Tax=Nephila pilipes TaxID=299642 RepID=A0A8X6PG32_NEPPI|nr:retrovirus-related Pol polyprotein from transposon 297 [Nephila pilipes]
MKRIIWNKQKFVLSYMGYKIAVGVHSCGMWEIGLCRIIWNISGTMHLNMAKGFTPRLQKANLKLSPKKCRFFQKEVSYLGHVISSEGVKTDPEKIIAVVDWPHPETVNELRSFLGLCTYYRRFVRNFSTIARPLHTLTEAKSNFNWTEDCLKYFNSLKQPLTTSPFLTNPRTDEDFILDTDASNEGIGAVLSQKIGNEECVIAYFSKSLVMIVIVVDDDGDDDDDDDDDDGDGIITLLQFIIIDDDDDDLNDNVY